MSSILGGGILGGGSSILCKPGHVSFLFFSNDPSEMRIYKGKNKRWEFQRVKCLQGMSISFVWVLNKITRYVKRVVNFLET